MILNIDEDLQEFFDDLGSKIKEVYKYKGMEEEIKLMKHLVAKYKEICIEGSCVADNGFEWNI